MNAIEGVLVAAGGAIGAGARAFIVLGAAAADAPDWVGTWTANLVGAALCGAFAGAWMERRHDRFAWRNDRWQSELFFVAGVCGGLTTLSAVSGDVATLWLRGEGASAIMDLTVHTVGGISVCAGSMVLARKWCRRRYCTP